MALALIVVVAFVYTEAKCGRKAEAVGHPGKGGLHWYTNFNDARAVALKSGKPMMVDFNASWCGPCRQYKEEVFNTAEFEAAARKFVLVDIDIDENTDLAKRFKIDPIPDIRFLNAQGSQIAEPVVGYAGLDLVGAMEGVSPDATNFHYFPRN